LARQEASCLLESKILTKKLKIYM